MNSESNERKTAPALWQSYDVDSFPVHNDEQLRSNLSLTIPNAVLREASATQDLAYFYAIGEAYAHVVNSFLPPNPTVLDVGCGSGKVARFLYMNPNLRYIGIDVFRPNIVWDRNAFSRVKDRFVFEYLDVYSALYNPKGTIKAEQVELPLSNGSADVVLCASLFTHLLLPECRRYLSEIARVLKPRGTAVISIHNDPPKGERFYGDPTRIDVDESFYVDLARSSGLRLKQVIGNIYGQQVLAFEPAIHAALIEPVREQLDACEVKLGSIMERVGQLEKRVNRYLNLAPIRWLRAFRRAVFALAPPPW